MAGGHSSAELASIPAVDEPEAPVTPGPLPQEIHTQIEIGWIRPRNLEDLGHACSPLISCACAGES